MFNERSKQEEIMDDFDCQGEVLHQTLHELDFINQTLGGNAITISALDKIKNYLPQNREISIVDLGCGSGEMLILINGWAQKNNLKVKLIGVDVNPHIIEFAQKHCKDYPNIELLAINIFSEEFSKLRFDIILSSLFTHHFSEDQLIRYYRNFINQSQVAIITNDLHRHPLAYYSIKWLTALFSKSNMVKFDAPVSVLRGFKKSEIENILKKSGIQQYQLTWKWAFRWSLIVRST